MPSFNLSTLNLTLAVRRLCIYHTKLSGAILTQLEQQQQQQQQQQQPNPSHRFASQPSTIRRCCHFEVVFFSNPSQLVTDYLISSARPDPLCHQPYPHIPLLQLLRI
ncbi:uncharacterized protein MEPE_04751 [Melanopsichium pennsylvanicum]|uniref:Uncharacterized protein n=1 Tax=Melanopsichium pennsylvanicum TaxID=63383 RepID=A0AAJ5C6N5_9BASI|nr:uncharacterized protein MEPE_04751 [Melanopsichium pennsylvanicum]